MSSISSCGLRSDIFQVTFDLTEVLRLDAISGNEINAEIQDAFEVVAEVDEFDADGRAKLNENIDIAIIALLITRVRAKHGEGLDAKQVKEFCLVR